MRPRHSAQRTGTSWARSCGGVLVLLLILTPLGCARTSVAYVEPTLPGGGAATLTLVPSADRTLTIHDIDRHLVGWTNHPVSSQWTKPAVEVAPGAHTIDCYLIARKGTSATVRYRQVSLVAASGHRYEVRDDGGRIIITDRWQGAALSAPGSAPIRVSLAPARMSLKELYEQVLARAQDAQDAKAAEYGIEAVHIAERLFGPEDAAVALALAAAYQGQGRDEEAQALYERILSALERRRGRSHPDVMAAAARLAALYHLRGQDALAHILYQRVLAFQEQTLGQRDPRLWEPVYHLAQLAHAHGQYAKADALYRRAGRLVGPTDPRAAATRVSYARLLRDMGKLRQAEAVEAAAARYAATVDPEGIVH